MRILITGGSGMVGNAFKEYEGCHLLSSKECDLREYSDVVKTICRYNPDAIIHLAAKVGGVNGNMKNQYDFFHDNLNININILKAANQCNIQYVISMLSTCIYPEKAQLPYTENQLHLGEPHPTNFGYAYAKRMLDVDSRIYREQFGRHYICVIPNNIYGTHDNFDLINGHVLPSLIRKTYEAKINNADLLVWGDGTSLREFTYSRDVARSIMRILNNVVALYKKVDILPVSLHRVNIGNTNEYTIKNVVEIICEQFDYKGNIVWDTSKPAGIYRKPTSNQAFKQIFLESDEKDNWFTSFEVGIKETCEWFVNNYPNVRGV